MMTFSCAITLTYVEKETFGDVLNFILAIILLLIVAALTIFIVAFYLSRFERMSNSDDKQFQKTYGAAYEGLKINKKMSLFQSFWLCLRRIIIVCLVFFLNHRVLNQLFVLQFLNFVAFIYISQVQPFSDSFLNKMEMF